MITTVSSSAAAKALEQKIKGKTVIPTTMKSAEIAKIPAEIYTRALMAATVDDAAWLEEAKGKLTDAVAQRKEAVARGDAFVTRSSFVRDMRAAATRRGLGDGTGSLTDVSGARRLRLIYDMQTRAAQGYARWKRDQNPGLRVAFPAQELVRRQQRKEPRDWLRRWVEAGGKLFNGRMIAMKADPVWTEISRFGTPWPPFDFGSGMGLRDVSRREALALGLIDADQPPVETPAQPDGKPAATAKKPTFNDGYEADVSGLDPEIIAMITKALGALVDIAAGKLILRGLS